MQITTSSVTVAQLKAIDLDLIICEVIEGSEGFFNYVRLSQKSVGHTTPQLLLLNKIGPWRT